MLSTIYPEFDWIPWKFHGVPKKFWTLENKKKFVDWISKELNYKDFSDFYKISAQV